MSLIESSRRAFFGERMPLPEGFPDGVLPDGVVLRCSRLIPRLGGLFARMRGPAAAVTLGRTIVVHPDARLTPTLLAHELAHVRQWQQDVLFPMRYALASLRHGYHQNPYEVEAREASAALAAQSPTAMNT